MNKKGQIFSVFMVIMTLVVLGMGYMNYLGSTTEEKIGSKQTKIMDAFQESREILLSLDTITKFAGIESIYTLAEKGGFSTNPPCDDYYGVPLWSFKNPEDEYTECIPEPTDEIIKSFSENFEDRLPKNAKYRNEYEFFSYQNASFHISAFPSDKNRIKIGGEKNRTYAYRPSVNKRFDYNLSTYDQIERFLSYLNEKCASKENTKEGNYLNDCVSENTEEFAEDNNISLSVIGPHNLEDKKFKIESFKESLNRADKTTYSHCYISTTTKEDYDDLIRVMNKKSSSMVGDSRLNTIFYPGEIKNDVPQPIDDLDSFSYLTRTNKIVKFEGEDADNKIKFNNIYKSPEGEGIISEEEPGLLRCPYENRKYIFKIEEPELYPMKGNLTYKFAFYINDSTPPEFNDLEIRDKEFDQNNLLVTWKHTKSRDLENYTVYLEGENRKVIKLWKDANIIHSIDWQGGNGKPYETCTLDSDEGECYYKSDGNTFVLKERSVYYAQENNQFIYVMPVEENDKQYDIGVTARDDDLNNYTLESKGKSVDDLPLKPLEKNGYTISPVCDPQTQIYESVMVTPLVPVLERMDGSQASDFNNEYIFFETFNKKVLNMDKGKRVSTLPGFVGLDFPHHITDQSTFLLVPKDPSLDNLDRLYINEMGYETYTPTSCWSK